MTIAQIRHRLQNLGYGLSSNKTDAFGKKHRWQTHPVKTANGGPTNYFDTKKDLIRYVEQVEFIRSIQEEPVTQRELLTARQIIHTYCKGKMSARPEFYSGRGAISCDLNSQLLEMIYGGIKLEISVEAARHFVQMVNDQESLPATHFLQQLYELEANGWVWKRKKTPVNKIDLGPDGPAREIIGICTIASVMGYNFPDQTAMIRGEFLRQHRDECEDCVLDEQKATLLNNLEKYGSYS